MSKLLFMSQQFSGMTFNELWQEAPRLLKQIRPEARLVIWRNRDIPAPLPFYRGWHQLDGDTVYLDYHLGPPEALHFITHDLPCRTERAVNGDVNAFFQVLRSVLFLAGHQQEIETQARTDWVTGLPRARTLKRRLQSLTEESAVQLELCTFQLHEPADSDTEAGHLQLFSFTRALHGILADEDEAFYLGGSSFALLGAGPRLQYLRENLDLIIPNGYWSATASTSEASGEALLTLAQERLEVAGGRALSASAARNPGANGLLPSGLLETPAGIYCDDALTRSALQLLTKRWSFEAPVNLFYDTPVGSALTQLANVPRPVLVVTSLVSQGYLSDLRKLEPEGILTGETSPVALREALLRVSRNESLEVAPIGHQIPLFPREQQLWSLLAQGHTNEEIAEELCISGKTVSNYVTNLREKLMVDDRTALVLAYWLPSLGAVQKRSRRNSDGSME